MKHLIPFIGVYKQFYFQAFLVITSLLCSKMVTAQYEDRNWVFGWNCGINFNDTANPQSFKAALNNLEPSASISAGDGKLLFYLSRKENDNLYSILNDQHEVISNGDYIQAHRTSTNGLLILPIMDNNDTLYYLFHLSCCAAVSNFYYSAIKKDSLGAFSVSNKNSLLPSMVMQERLCGIKHANGKYWWMLAHKDPRATGATNLFYKLLITENGIEKIDSQGIGEMQHSESSSAGEISVFRNGNRIAMASTGDGYIELFNFNRCTGILSNPILVEDRPVGFDPYGCAFSSTGNYLYVSEGLNSGDCSIFQYYISNDTIIKTVVATLNQPAARFGQLELAPDSNIYLALYRGFFFDSLYQNLAVINNPDSAGLSCDYQFSGFYLGDSARSTASLPNMPNYNLEPLSIYQADAGIDTVICTEDSVKGIFLGIPAIEGVAYEWYPADSLHATNVARPFADPTQSTWYYVTLTDTSIKYSCQSRVDSVFVEVNDCSVGMGSNHEELALDIYPNPAHEMLNVSLNHPNEKIQQVIIVDLNGKEKLRSVYSEISVSALARGVYFVRVDLMSGNQAVRKVVVQ